MEWTKLDIRKASVLKKQVDLALLTLKQALLDGDVVKRNALITSFNTQIDNIEEFRAMYDSDERSILFERERLRLRKAVQESTSSSIANGQNNTNDGTNDAFKGAAGGAHKNAYQTMKTPEVSARGAAANSSLRKNSPEKERSSITTPAPSIPQSPSKKIYAWEEKESSSADQIKERSTLVIDGANFVPAKEAGIYLRDNELTADVGLGTKENLKSMDMFVVLTADEINLLASRMLHSKAKDKSIFKNAYSQMGVQHSTPYVDPSRVMAGLLRPEQPQKWVDKNSLRPNAK